VEKETELSRAASRFPQQPLGGHSAEKLVFLLPTGRNLGGERNIGGTARLFRKAHFVGLVVGALQRDVGGADGPGAVDALEHLSAPAGRINVRSTLRLDTLAQGNFCEGNLVRKEGFEPPRPFGHKILSLARLPVPPLPQWC
jgi:hypothetical protein